MKRIMLACLLVSAVITAGSFIHVQQASITGAWKKTDANGEVVMILHDNYLTQAAFDKAGKKFHYTKGGVASTSGNKLTIHYEFNTQQNDQVGNSVTSTYAVENGQLIIQANGAKETWTRIDDNQGALAGTWRISGRMQGGEMRTMNPGARKTYKILSGTRFQWVAMNTETKQISGTGGGTYTFENGKYTEHIEFFSRDSSRVGASLTFDGSVSNNVWTHKGLSSRGEPIHEEWTKVQ
jgi:hypothetical protein